MDVSAGPATVATVRPSPAPIQRVVHPAIPAPEYKCYRVIRQYKANGRVEVETIGAFKREADALQFINTEVWWAAVLDLNGKRLALNWQPMETRS